MKVPVPDEILPAERAGPRALRRHRRRRSLGDRPDHAGARRRGLRQRRQRLPDPARAARRSGRPVHVGHDAAHVGDADTVVVSTAVREDNPEVVAARRRGLRILPRSAGLGLGDGRHARPRRGRHARQDHHHLAADLGPARPPAPTRRTPSAATLAATGAQRPRRHRRPLRRRGRRERRRLPASTARRRGRHQRRGRPPRPLRHRGGLPRAPSTTSSTGSTPTASWSACVDDAGAAALADAARAPRPRRRHGGGVRGRRPARRRPRVDGRTSACR